MGKDNLNLVVHLSFHLTFCLINLSAATATADMSSPACPMDLAYVRRIPWNKTLCHSLQPPQNLSISNTEDDITTQQNSCCGTLLSLFGVGLAQNLKQTSLFRLPNLPTSVSCLQDFQSKLSSLSLPQNLVSSCFDPSEFVINRNRCAHIETTKDWVAQLGVSTPIDSACKPDLTDLTACDECVTAGIKLQTTLTSIDGNKSHSTDCFYFTILYAAGIVNEYGPESNGAVTCILLLDLDSDVGSGGSNHSGLILGITGGIFVVLVVASLLGLYFWYDRKKRRKMNPESSPDLDEQVPRPKWRPNTGSIWFNIQDLEKATDNFSDKNFIGRGGFGFVYKGVLSDGSVVAVKRIMESDFQGDDDFCNEVQIISNLNHRNLLPLRGCCVVDEDSEIGSQRYLVYDYMQNGNLNDHLFPSPNRKKPLTWPERKSIILDVANGLAYLHHGVKPAIYHRDIKGTNILLDGEMRARVADFGLAKQSPELGQPHFPTKVAGTHGYLAPEYALYGQLSEKSDVYSFGVVVLEILCGRKALDLSSSGAFLITDWAWSLVKAGNVEDVLDTCLLSNVDASNLYPMGIMERFLMVGILCAHVTVASRPTILDALKMLEGDIEVPQIPDRPIPLGHPSFLAHGLTSSISPHSQTVEMHCEGK